MDRRSQLREIRKFCKLVSEKYSQFSRRGFENSTFILSCFEGFFELPESDSEIRDRLYQDISELRKELKAIENSDDFNNWETNLFSLFYQYFESIARRIIARSKEQIEELHAQVSSSGKSTREIRESKEKINRILDEIIRARESAASMITTLQSIEQNSKRKDIVIKNRDIRTKEKAESIGQTASKVQSIFIDVQSTVNELRKFLSLVSEAEANFSKIFKEAKEKLRDNDREVKDYILRLEVLERRAQEALTNATAGGIASIFLGRRAQLKRDMRINAMIITGLVIAIVGFSAWYVRFGVQGDENVSDFWYLKLTFLAPPIYALVFSVQQYAKSRILEEQYALKGVLGSAYPAFKKELVSVLSDQGNVISEDTKNLIVSEIIKLHDVIFEPTIQSDTVKKVGLFKGEGQDRKAEAYSADMLKTLSEVVKNLNQGGSQ